MSNLFELMIEEQQKQELQKITGCNEKTAQFGLALSGEEAKELLVYRQSALKDSQRVEFVESILPKLIFAFCDSQYIIQENYLDTLSELQDIFYAYKNESKDEMTDDELIGFMRQQFEEICFGDIEYLRDTCLERYTRAIRSGYQGRAQKRLRDEYSLGDTENEYTRFADETRWDFEVYKRKLEDMS